MVRGAHQIRSSDRDLNARVEHCGTEPGNTKVEVIMKGISLIGVLTVIAIGACRPESISTDSAPSGRVTVTREQAGIRVTNHTDQGVAYAISNPNWLGLLAICNDPEPACIRLQAGASVLVPFSEIQGFESGAEKITVHWWHVVPDGVGQFRATDPVQIIVPLQ